MELRQLEYFVAVAEEGSFTRAAQRTHVAQPGISAQIKQLERELGEPLFERVPHGARLTGAGTAALVHARAALSAAAATRESVAELAGLVRGRVVIGTITAGRALDLAQLLATFHRRYPGVEIALREGTSDLLLGLIAAGELDLAWVGRSTGDLPTGVAGQTVVDERLAAVVAFEHPLAARRTLRLAELAEHPVICLPPGTGTRDALDAGARTAGLRLHVAFETTEPLVSADLARHGLGVGVVPASAAEYLSDRLHGLSIVAPAMRTRLELAWAQAPNGQVSGGPATRALVAHARQFVTG